MRLEERIERDGPRWRYVKLLEDEVRTLSLQRSWLLACLAIETAVGALLVARILAS